MKTFKILLESILLTEGRIERAKERYPEVSGDIFNYFVVNDPSDNQKYLDWMLGAFTSGGRSYTSVLSDVSFFHDNIHQFEVKDINRYKDIYELSNAIDVVREKMVEKEIDEKAKKEKDVIYVDSRWLVISPKTHRASCKYGAGTKWCVTSKDTDTHWDSYSKNATFFFIIDKTKDSDDKYYKVAYRKIGRRNRYELWDAEDNEFSYKSVGRDYIDGLPEELKSKILEYHDNRFPSGSGKDLEDLSSEGQALANFLDHTDFNNTTYTHYGMDVFETDDGEEYAVGTDEEADDAHKEFWTSYIDDVGYELNVDSYLTMTDKDGFIDNEVDYYMENLSDDEIIEYGYCEDEIREILDKLDLDPDELDEGETEDTLRRKLDELMEESRDYIRDMEKNSWEDCLNDPVYCLTREKGWFGDIKELIKSGVVEVDTEEMVNDYVNGGDRGESLSSYDGYEHEGFDLEGKRYYIYRIN